MSRRVQGLDKALERHLLVLECLQRRLADPVQGLAEGGIAGQVGADHQRVDQKSHQAFGVLADASGNGRADGKIVLAAVAVQQHLERRQQGHVERGPFAPPDFLHAIGQGRGQHAPERGPGVADLRRAGTIRGQFQGRKPFEPATPVGQQPIERFALQVLPLPGGIVGILDGQFRQRRGPAGRKRLVQGRQFVEQHAHRPVVGNDVVHHDHKEVLGRGEPQEQRTEQRPFAQPERPPGLLRRPGHGLGFATRRIELPSDRPAAASAASRAR